MDIAVSISTVLQTLGGIFIVSIANQIMEHLLGRKLLSAVWIRLRKAYHKNLTAVHISFIYRIDFNNEIDTVRLKSVIRSKIHECDESAQWNDNSISYEAINSFAHRIKIELLTYDFGDDAGQFAEAAFVTIKTEVRIGHLKDYLTSVSFFSDQLLKHLTTKYNMPFLVNNAEFEIKNPNAKFDVPKWLENENFKLRLVAEASENFNLQLYLDHAKIETNGITFEPKMSKYLEEIFINYYVKDSKNDANVS